jgi:hypothetical protein
MVGDRVGGGSAGGGGSAISIDDIQGMGFATEQWVNEKYLSIDFFNRLFQAYDSAATPNQVLPNDLESTITNIKAMFGFWTEQFVSALGYGPGGGGGGDTLTEPLASINNASLGMPTAAGQVITWNGSEWIFDIPQGGGGGGTGTVTSITAGTGLSGGTITTMGTIAISSTYQGYISHGETAYGWGNHAEAGYATQQWVNQQGFLTSSAISDMATKTWVGQQGYVTLGTTQTINATKTFTAYQTMRGINLDTQGDIRQELLNNGGTFYLGYNAGGGSTGFNLAYSPDAVNVSQLVSVLTNGNVGIGNNSPSYKMDVSGNIHTSTAFYLDNKLFANNNNSGLHIGYGFAAADLPTTLWGDEISFRSIDGTYGECTTIGNTYGIMGTDFIGVTNKFRFEYDSTNNTVWVLKSDGTAVNFASLGGVSALGISTGGTPSLSVLTLQNLTVNGSATIASLTVRNTISSLTVDDLDVSNNLYMNGCDISMDGGYINNCGTLGADAIETGTLLVGSGSEVKKIQWDGTYLQVQIGTTTYKFRPDVTS